jgi:glycosyltransferase involved in cell wall biosynthesis
MGYTRGNRILCTWRESSRILSGNKDRQENLPPNCNRHDSGGKEQLKILIVNTHEKEGGAARSAYRLHKGLLSIGAESRMLVQYKKSDDPTIIGPKTKVGKGLSLLRPELDSLPLIVYRNRTSPIFSPQWVPGFHRGTIAKINPDVINLHWVCEGFLNIESITGLKRPVVWTLHDPWAFTGGCHYPSECTRYIESCGCCPHLQSLKVRDLSHRVWKRKKKAYRRIDLTVVTPSRWLAACAKSSSLLGAFRTEVIPNGLDLNRFRPMDNLLARDLLNLPPDKHLILFGAVNATEDTRKGFQYLVPALQKLKDAGWQDKVEIVIFGSSRVSAKEYPAFKTHYLGTMNDDLSLSLAYAAADAFIAPSIQENLSNTVMESIACGTPCIAFNIGGMPDMIEHWKNGYLANPFDIEDLANGISWVIEDPERTRALGRHAREKAEQEFSLELQARRYLTLYEELLKYERVNI